MRMISYARHRFPSSIIQRAVWLYSRFPLSLRDVEELLAERGIDSRRTYLWRAVDVEGEVLEALGSGPIKVLETQQFA